MRPIHLILVLPIFACDVDHPIKPDSTAGSGGTSSAISSGNTTGAGSGANGGTGGTGGTDDSHSLPCDPCENVDGSRLILRRYVFDSADGAHFVQRSANFYDTFLKEPCSRSMAEDGLYRCIPTIAVLNAGIFFADAVCSNPVAYSLTSPCSSNVPKFAHQTVSGPDVCNHAVAVFHVGALHVSDVFTNASGSCTPWSGSGYTFYSLGEKVSPSAFVLLAAAFDP